MIRSVRVNLIAALISAALGTVVLASCSADSPAGTSVSAATESKATVMTPPSSPPPSSQPPSSAPPTSVAKSKPDEFAWPTTIARKPTTFTFADGWKATGELTFPATGSGPFPTVILLHGSGANDIDQTIPGEPGDSKILRQVAAELSGRGFLVVRYNKRGVTSVGPVPDPSIKTVTLTQYISDASEVLSATRKLPNVDSTRIVLLGHSEGTLTASALTNSPNGKDVAGLVLMGVVGRDIKTTLQFQLIDRNIDAIKASVPKSETGLTAAFVVSMFATASEDIRQRNYDFFQMEVDATSDAGYKFARSMDLDADGVADFETELRPNWVKRFNTSFPDLTDFGFTPDDTPWIADSQTYGTVGGLLKDFTKPVLMMNGEADIQTIVDGAREAHAALIASGNETAVIKTYPGLGHTFYPATGLQQPLGPMEPAPLRDLGDWMAATFNS